MLRLDGKIAIVTGGASGIGAATARRLGADGARVAIADVDVNKGEALSASINGSMFVRLDVTDEDNWIEAIAEVNATIGVINVLVNNAGISPPAPIELATLEHFHKVMSVNVDGVFLGCKHGVLTMKGNGGGSIINLSSIMGVRGSSLLPAYCASKGAVRLLTKATALRCAEERFNIRCNSVHPGAVETPIMDAFIKNEESRQAVIDNFTALHPMGRLGLPDEIANGIAFLASDESSFMTGSELHIDGGALA